MTIWLAIKLMLSEFWNWKKDERAIVLVRYGHFIKMYPSKRVHKLPEGYEYHYSNEIVMVPYGLEWDWLGAHRLIGVVDGECVATPFAGSGQMQPQTFVSDWCRGNSAVKLNKSFKTALEFSLKWLLVVAVVGIAGYFLYQQFGGDITGGGSAVPLITPFGGQ